MYKRKQVKKQRERSDVDKYPEKKLETWTCGKAKGLKYRPLKFYSKVDTGWMDRIFLSPSGVTIWAEFKVPSGKLAALQRENRKWLIMNDHIYFLLDTWDKCVWFAENILPRFI